MEENGVWRTVGGRRIFIKDGQDLASAMKESGKFKEDKNNENTILKIRKPQDISLEEIKEIKEIADIRDEDGFKQGIEKAVFDKYGMNKKYPQIISDEEFKKYNGKEIYRGIGADSEEKATKYKNEFLKGDIYSGYNNSGSGTWFTENKGIADNYKSGGGGTTIKNGEYSFVIDAKIDNDAKIIKSSELPSKKERIMMYKLENEPQLQKIVYDDGLYATMLGYDVLETQVGFTQKFSNYSILNREILKVKK